MIEPEAGMMVTPNLRLVRRLGGGGMGSVWAADHLALHTQVVVKFMSPDLAGSPDAVSRFAREAAAASQVKSPHVVQMLDHGVSDGAPYIVMELLEGRDLAATLEERGKLTPLEVLAVVVQLARALTKAHARGIVHRDIKPNNVFLCDAGSGELFVKLLDFGIAKGASPGDRPSLLGITTRTGAFVGSPYYMSPEQVVGAKTIDYRTDLWSLGVVVFEALTGAKPFFADTVGGLALKIHRDPLPVPSEVLPGLPPAIDAWFARACARAPEERFASAKELADALAVAVTGERATPVLAMVDSASNPGSLVGGRSPGSALPLSDRPPAARLSGSGSSEPPGRASSLARSGADEAVGFAAVAPRTRGRTSMTRGLVALGIGLAAVGVGFGVSTAVRRPALGPGPIATSAPSAPEARSVEAPSGDRSPRPAERRPAERPDAEPPGDPRPPDPTAALAASGRPGPLAGTGPATRPAPVLVAPRPRPSAGVPSTRPPASAPWSDDDIR